MISLDRAQQLRAAGLGWTPQLHDFFAIPLPGLDDRVFVLGDMMAEFDHHQGEPVVTFNGSSEWALDSIISGEVVWLPNEAQLRHLIEQRLPATPGPRFTLTRDHDDYHCQLTATSAGLTFTAPTAEDAYAQALLHLLSLTA